MTTFRSVRKAKEYLVGRIAAEAEREGTPLTKIERGMLYFSESGGISREMEQLCAEFDRDYNEDAYEEKICRLIRAITAQNDAANEQDRAVWDDAVLKLCDEDNYLLTLIDAAQRQDGSVSAAKRWLPMLNSPARRMPGDRIRLVLVALGVLILALAIRLIADRFWH